MTDRARETQDLLDRIERFKREIDDGPYYGDRGDQRGGYAFRGAYLKGLLDLCRAALLASAPAPDAEPDHAHCYQEMRRLRLGWDKAHERVNKLQGVIDVIATSASSALAASPTPEPLCQTCGMEKANPQHLTACPDDCGAHDYVPVTAPIMKKDTP